MNLTNCYLKFKAFINNQEGIGAVEMILILFVLIGVVMLFKEHIMAIAEKYLGEMDPNFVR